MGWGLGRALGRAMCGVSAGQGSMIRRLRAGGWEVCAQPRTFSAWCGWLGPGLSAAWLVALVGLQAVWLLGPQQPHPSAYSPTPSFLLPAH